MLKLYSLKPIVEYDNWYDKCYGFIISATSETEARQYAANQCGDEGSEIWYTELYTDCVLITEDSPFTAGVYMQDFRGT